MTLTLLLLACLLTCAGQIAQKYAVEGWRGVDTGVAQKLRSPWLWLALLCLGLGLLVWLLVLQQLDVGVAYPMLSLNFVWVTLAAWGIWREPVARRHWVGVGLIVVGIVILGSRI